VTCPDGFSASTTPLGIAVLHPLLGVVAAITEIRTAMRRSRQKSAA
jgi:hypothetical protein